MHILLTGLNHKTASLDLRERIAFTAEQLSEALPILRGDVGEAVILSTCNRTEVYIVSNKPSLAASGIRTFLAGYHGLDGTLPPDSLQDLVDADAVRHLFRVAGGLDSMIIGESQILGQVRGALAAAAAADIEGKALLTCGRGLSVVWGVGDRHSPPPSPVQTRTRPHPPASHTPRRGYGLCHAANSRGTYDTH